MFTEVAVPRKDNPLLVILQWVCAISGICCILAGILLFPLLLLAGALLGFAAWLLSRRMGLEFQYSLVEDELRIDKIIGDSRRTPVANITAGQIVAAVPARSPEAARFAGWHTVDVSDGTQSETCYVVACNREGQGQRFLLSVTPPMAAALKKLLGPKFLDL